MRHIENRMKSCHRVEMAATSTQKARNNDPTGNRGSLFIGLYLRNIAANFFSFVVIVLLNAITPLHFFESRREIFLVQGGWVVFVLFFVLTILLVLAVQYYIQRPIELHAHALRQGREIHPGLEKKARVRLLNLPVVIALIDLAVDDCVERRLGRHRPEA